MSDITTHVLDTARGRPGVGVPVRLEIRTEGGWEELGAGVTDQDGRLGGLTGGNGIPGEGAYRITFDTGAYFARQGVEGFYPEASVVFRVARPEEHHHVPLLLSPFGYVTYRGS